MPMTKQEAAAFLGKSPATIQWYAKKGQVQIVGRTTGRNAVVYYNAADIAQIGGKPLPPKYNGEQPSRPVDERLQRVMTLEQASAVVDRSVSWIKINWVKTGIVRVIDQGRGCKPMLIAAEDVMKLASTIEPTDRNGPGRPRKEERRNLFASKCDESGTVLMTAEVKRAGRRLIEALAQACRDARMTPQETEGGIAYFVASLGDDLEARVRILHKARDVRNHTRDLSAIEARA